MPTDEQVPTLFKYSGSMTEQLEQKSGRCIKILQRQEFVGRTFRFIASMLGQPSNQRLWQREVLLGDTRPWLYGRTVALPAARRPALSPLQKLGDQPLGPVLFDQLGALRVHAQSLSLPPEHPLISSLECSEPLWSRLSLFAVDWHSIFVQETILPECPLT